MKVLILVAVLVAGTYATLTESEANSVKTSWNLVKDKEDEILYAIFKENPDIQARFPLFVSKNLEEIKTSADFKTHADKIVKAISTYINLLGNEANTPAIKTTLNELGQRHKDRGATTEQFEKFKVSVLKYVKEHATGLTADAENAWNKAFEEMYKIVFANLSGNPVS
uniref:Globin n=1 Tax=Polypedilum nubifer TaxID=54969 RepID=V5YNC2_9DIPT|nr:globin [Polypedilum nubifer]